ncbi:pilin [Psychrobacter sp. 4Bb]|uniref:pilin n=1 Tax=Psychrobacter sp. 4Bb TaxID=888436 RepID=UPI000C7E4E57|nr:pilin [Psychrobacter sp. 4Bb]PKH81725.1 prepilin-type cleavage/methylation domain-containing protein [Psychrobacter sp. 4Bb]
MNTAQKGFTLIELMIVVAIIGILAAIAIPQYQNYVGRSNVAAAVATLSSNKTGLEDYVLSNGAFPDGKTVAVQGKPAGPGGTPAAVLPVAGQTPADLGIVNSTIGETKIANVAATPGAGKVQLKFANGNPGIKDKIVQLERDANGTWTCLTDVEEKFAGKACPVTKTAITPIS